MTRPNDWFGVQPLARSMLEITLRDPWMKQAGHSEGEERALAGVGGSAGDQCPRGTPWYQGDACLIAVVRFNGTLQTSAMNITLFAGNGSKIRTGFWPGSAMGVAIVRLPTSVSNLTFASVNYREPHGGTHKGQSYDFVDHWATTSVVLQR